MSWVCAIQLQVDVCAIQLQVDVSCMFISSYIRKWCVLCIQTYWNRSYLSVQIQHDVTIHIHQIITITFVIIHKKLHCSNIL